MGRERGRGGGGARYRREPGSRDAYRTPRPGRPGRENRGGPPARPSCGGSRKSSARWPSRVAGVRPRQGSGGPGPADASDVPETTGERRPRLRAAAVRAGRRRGPGSGSPRCLELARPRGRPRRVPGLGCQL
ncbi:uncharacterized protein LOC143272396 [Peromyscus maniculatus bairdii]|uniref:uncharacterized protein LOC143272396 n=1 Tax=Peromyscus maniculatus bairdii TaxID=230844 RepID=UPI003FD4E214